MLVKRVYNIKQAFTKIMRKVIGSRVTKVEIKTTKTISKIYILFCLKKKFLITECNLLLINTIHGYPSIENKV